MRNSPYSRQIEQVLQLTSQQGSGGMLHLARGLRVTKTVDHLLFSYPSGITNERGDLLVENCDSNTHVFVEIPGPGKYSFEELGLSFEIILLDKSNTDYKNNNKDIEYFDADRCSFPLTLRSLKPGDRFHPLGSPGSKKITDFLGDQKTAREHRSHEVVLLSGETIIALLGHRIAHDYRITSKTTSVIKIEWSRLTIVTGNEKAQHDKQNTNIV